MEIFSYPVFIRWADIDANNHLRHSVYYDWGATCRMEFLFMHGVTMQLMEQIKLGPILFREECVFRRELKYGDTPEVSLEIIAAKKNYSRWSIRHNVWKDKETVSAIITVEGAWLDTIKRKLAVPPEDVAKGFALMPKSKDFIWLDK
ncbi:MAG: acyl-CoA thioesterase [Bacteroidetes bacterium]|nr:acyl-CoA thioesterase [Bacteroidota bacterium]